MEKDKNPILTSAQALEAHKELDAWGTVRSHLTDKRYTEKVLYKLLLCEIYYRAPRPHVVSKLFKRYWKLKGNRSLVEILASVNKRLGL